jgi:hypothetical protein
MVCQDGRVTCGARLSPQVYVYDLIITGGDIAKLKQFREEMKTLSRWLILSFCGIVSGLR